MTDLERAVAKVLEAFPRDPAPTTPRGRAIETLRIAYRNEPRQLCVVTEGCIRFAHHPGHCKRRDQFGQYHRVARPGGS